MTLVLRITFQYPRPCHCGKPFGYLWDDSNQWTGGFGNANLFLMNPAGFLFGPNATVNVGGMVAFTTADYLAVSRHRHRCSTVHQPLNRLARSRLPRWQLSDFLGSNPAAIAIQGSTLRWHKARACLLWVGIKGLIISIRTPAIRSPSQTESPMTGGKLLAPGGQINIASVA